jgi:urea transporter
MITAALPDPSQPSFVVLAAAFGAFIGASVARLQGADRDDLRRSVEDWAYVFTAVALAFHLAILGLESL